jgi:hypothetical protein
MCPHHNRLPGRSELEHSSTAASKATGEWVWSPHPEQPDAAAIRSRILSTFSFVSLEQAAREQPEDALFRLLG